MHVAWSAQQGAHYHADVCLLAPFTGNKEESRSLMVLRVRPTPTRFPTNSLYTPMDNTTSHSTFQVCATRGAGPAVSGVDFIRTQNQNYLVTDWVK